MSIREQAERLTSIFSRRSAERAIREELRRNPKEAVGEALQALRELRARKQSAAKRLHQILVKEARNPRIAGALAEKALERDVEAAQILEEAGYPIRKLVQVLERVREVAATLPTPLETLEGWLKRRITEVEEKARAGRLDAAVSTLEQAVEVVEGIVRAEREIHTAKPPTNRELTQTYEKLVKEAENTLKRHEPGQGTRKLAEIAEKLHRLEETDRELTTIKQKLTKATATEPGLVVIAKKIAEQASKKAAINPDPEALKQEEQEAETLLTLAQKINAVRKVAGDEPANQILEKARQNTQEALELAETTTHYAQTIKQTGITPQELEQYLKHITKNYPKQITEKTKETLRNPPKNTQILKQEIKNKKPPYKTHQQTKTTNLKQVIQAIKKQTWESRHLGGDVYSIAFSPDQSKVAVGIGWEVDIINKQGKVVVFSSSGEKLWESPDLGEVVRSVAWSPDSTKIAAGGNFKKVIVFSSSGSKLWESPDLGGVVLSVAFSPDSTKIATGGDFKKVIVFGFGLGGLCDVVCRVLVSGVGVSEVVGGSGVCGVLGGWVLGDCGGVSGAYGVVGDALEFLCRGDIGGVLAVLGFALDSGYWDGGLFEVVRALSLGWGGRLLEFDSIVSDVGRVVGVDVPSVFDWLVDLLGSGRSVLSVAEEVREVVGWVLENAGRLREAASDGRFAAFVRGARYGGLRGFVEVLREGLSFLESPSKYFRVRVGFEGSFTAGSFSEGVARVCNDSVTQVAVTSVSFSGVEGSVLSGVPLVLRPRECGEVGVSLRVPTPGRVPVEVSVSGEVAGVSVSSVVRVVVDASPSPAPSPSLGAGVRGRVPEAPPYLSPHYLVGKVLSLSFSPPSLKPPPC